MSIPRNPRGLLRVVLEEMEEQPFAPGYRFGDYEILKFLGSGGIGFVYLAQHASVHPQVALKVIRDGAATSRFKNGATAAAQLQHDGIVGVFHVGMHDQRAFYTMRYVGDENLEDVIPSLRESPAVVAELLAKVARAVHHAHEREILHRDLKPSNILIERRAESYEPFVADFDLAKRLNPSGRVTASQVIGTPDYMSPEQIRGGAEQLGATTDVYSLGVILYEILAHQVPFPTLELSEKLRQIEFETPRFPSSLRAVDPDLEAICLRCLKKNPSARYASAEALALELERVAARKKPHEPRVSLPARAHAWVRWHRGFAFLLVTVLALLFTFGALLVDREQRKREELEVLGSFAAGQAGAVLFQLHQNGQHVGELAEDPFLLELLDRSAPDIPSSRLAARARDFDTVFLAKISGEIWAQWPEPPRDVRGRDFTFRDYFKGGVALARKGKRGSYLARALSSEATRQMSFGFSAPVYRDGRPVGILVALHNVGSAFRAAGMVSEPEIGHRTAVLGPRDVDRGGRAFPSEFTFLVHPLLGVGSARVLPSKTSGLLREHFGSAAPPGEQFGMTYTRPVLLSDYEDPVEPSDTRWLAAFAPIGNTGYIVAIQAQKAPLGWALPFGLGLALTALLWSLGTRRTTRGP